MPSKALFPFLTKREIGSQKLCHKISGQTKSSQIQKFQNVFLLYGTYLLLIELHLSCVFLLLCLLSLLHEEDTLLFHKVFFKAFFTLFRGN